MTKLATPLSFSEYRLKANDFLAHKRLLVIAPHADDETFGCGGTIAKAKALGSEVFVIVVSVGNLAHYDQTYHHVSGDTRAGEFADAMRVLGVDGHTILFHDAETHMRVDRIPRRDLVAQIERESELSIERTQPDVILLPAVSFNQDHEAVFKAVFAACRPHLPSDKAFARLVLAYDQPQLAWNHTPFHPNFYVDISDFLERKLAAYACHRSQVRPDPHHASLENVERLARLRGSEVSVRAAEAFYCHRCVI
jgi:LmbE family N-acetylglucosaminyl deacetylase